MKIKILIIIFLWTAYQGIFAADLPLLLTDKSYRNYYLITTMSNKTYVCINLGIVKRAFLSKNELTFTYEGEEAVIGYQRNNYFIEFQGRRVSLYPDERLKSGFSFAGERDFLGEWKALGQPWGLTITKSGKGLLITDSEGNKVRVIYKNGIVYYKMDNEYVRFFINQKGELVYLFRRAMMVFR